MKALLRPPNVQILPAKDPEQSKLFIQKAREIDADEEHSAADDLLGTFAKRKPEPRKTDQMTTSIQPCGACLEQVKRGLYDKAHARLTPIASKAFRGSMFGGHEEITYKCSACGSMIHHMHDKNDFAPFWYFVDAPPSYL